MYEKENALVQEHQPGGVGGNGDHSVASSLAGMPLPDAAVRAVGVLQMIALAVFAFSAIRCRRM